MLQDILKIVESEIEVIRQEFLGVSLDHRILDLLVYRIQDRVKEECLPPLMSPEQSAQESTRCHECSLSEERCIKHRKE